MAAIQESSAPFPKLSIGVSQCLLGDKVRFNGDHKRCRFVTDTLSPFVDYVTICPEMGAGLGVPRPPIQLNKSSGVIRVVQINDPSIDVTQPLLDFSRQSLPTFDTVSGFILKSKSPSCGMERVNIKNAKGQYEKKGVGIFAKLLMERYPYLPVEEEGRLNDPVIRDNFITRIYAYRRWQDLSASSVDAAKLIHFHQIHKLLIMSHNVSAYQRLGRIVANLKQQPLQAIQDLYLNEFTQALKTKANIKKHTNVLQHIAGYLKKEIDADDKQELHSLIMQYNKGLIPLIVPISLLNHFFRKHPNDYIAQQVYLNPHPSELMLRNHV